MSTRQFIVLVLIGTVAGILPAAGCAGEQRTAGSTRDAGTDLDAGASGSGGSGSRSGAQSAGRTAWPTRRTDGSTTCTSMAYPTGTASTSALGIEKVVPREARVDQPFQYEIVVTNLTAGNLNDVVVTEEADESLRITGSTPKGQGSGASRTWSLGALGARESRTITVNAVAGTEGAVGSCATVSYVPALCAAIPIVSPKLQLVKRGPAEALRCDPIEYRFEISNVGSGSIADVHISDQLAEGLTAVGGGRTVSFDVGTLGAGQTRAFTTRAQAERVGRFASAATATGSGGITAKSSPLSTVIRAPRLEVATKCAPRQYIGRSISFEITVTNKGDGEARDAVIEDTLAPGLQFVGASEGGRQLGSRVVWSLGTLAPAGSTTVSVQASPREIGKYECTALARATCADPVSSACTTDVVGIDALLLEVVDIEDPVRVGENGTYVITVTNQGTAPGTNIRITCAIESNQEYVSSSGATAGTATAGRVTFAPLPTLPPGDKATFRVVLKGVKVGDVRFKASMTSDQLTRPVEETEATRVYE